MQLGIKYSHFKVDQFLRANIESSQRCVTHMIASPHDRVTRLVFPSLPRLLPYAPPPHALQHRQRHPRRSPPRQAIQYCHSSPVPPSSTSPSNRLHSRRPSRQIVFRRLPLRRRCSPPLGSRLKVPESISPCFSEV